MGPNLEAYQEGVDSFTSVMTALTFALLPVQAFQDAVVDTLIQWRDGFMNIVYSQETDRQHFDIASKINLSCILTGFLTYR